jgi:predicted outer membrane lipoprotein
VSAQPIPARWKTQAAWLLGALLLAAFAVWWPYWQDRKDYRLWHSDLPRAVAPGQWGHYEDARWRVVDARVVTLSALDGVTPRPDSQVVVATLDVIPDNGSRIDRLDGCKTALRDATGRRWIAQPLALSRYRPRPYGVGCSSRTGADFKRVRARPGRPFRFVQVYQLPRDVPLAGLTLELKLPALEREPRGTFLQIRL